MYVHVYTMYVHVPLMYNVCTCLYIVCTCIYTVHNFNQLSQQVFRFRRSGMMGTWMKCGCELVQTCLYCVHILTFMNVCVPCTYKCITTWTCMYNLHTFKFRYIHVQGTDMYVHVQVCAFMNMCEHVHTCLYHVQTRMYRFAQSCPGGQDSRWPVWTRYILVTTQAGHWHDSRWCTVMGVARPASEHTDMFRQSSMVKKSWTQAVPNLGVIVFAHNRISRYTIMRNEVFVYLRVEIM